jgi:viroplasmin and RNaseH domain-containing protein
MNKYRKTFKFFNTEEQAKTFCENTNKAASRYVRKNHAALYTPWSSTDGKENLFIVWYVI